MKQLPENLRIVVENNKKLRRYLRALLLGKKSTPRSWLYEDLVPEDVLDIWLDHLSTLESSDNEFETRVYQFDTSQLSKWGPQGGVAPIRELYPLLEKSFEETPTPKAFNGQSKYWNEAKHQATYDFAHALSGGKLQPVSYENVVVDMKQRDTLESNSGWPLFERRSNPKTRRASIADARSGKWKEYPAIVLFRNYNNKTRPVWMYPMATNLVEGSYCQPLQSALMKTDLAHLGFFSPWEGFSTVRQLVSNIYNQTSDTIAASDFSETDVHFRKAATLEVYDVIAPLYQPQHRAGLLESLTHMHEIPLVVGPDSYMTGEHGVSSGSVWTNFIETIFDFILGKYVNILSLHSKRRVASLTYGLYGIGDDMSWWTDGHNADFARQLERVGKEVGQIINEDKTTNEPNAVKSLQRLFQRGYKLPKSDLVRAVYPTVRALKSSIYPEKFHNPKKWNSDMFCVRQFMILENCVDHPLFKDFVQFVCRGQKDLIPFAKQKSSKIDKAQRQARLLPGLNTTYNQEKRDSKLSTFSSIQIARNM